MALCNPWYVTHDWGIWRGLAIPGQPEARPVNMVRVCQRCCWEQRKKVRD